MPPSKITARSRGNKVHTDMIQEKKKRIRLELLKKLKSHKEEDRFRKSTEIAKKLFSLKNYLKAKTVLFYLSLD